MWITVALGCFLLFGVLLNLAGWNGLRKSTHEKPITSYAELTTKKVDTGVVFQGVISKQNEKRHGDYIAYLDEKSLWSPERLWLELDGGRIAINNTQYQAVSWPVDPLGNLYLTAEQPVIVIGILKNYTENLKGEQPFQQVRAEVVFGGSYQAFVSRASVKASIAMALALANLIIAGIILTKILPVCVRGMKS
ncbi:MAG: hypothetical protein KJ630_21435 [Proteobacteria bacterium]|nr:hypothetical protein [Pseudomonadota bacterium]